ncbi:MAG: HdeD family acid-resistance protein [Anaerorhabdus sp.]
MRIITVLLGIVAVISGFYCMMSPGATFLSLAWIAGIVLVASGLRNGIYYFMNRKTDNASIWVLLGGIFSVIIGLMILGDLGLYILTDLFIIYAFAIWLVLSAFSSFGLAFALKKQGQKWIGVLIVSILTLVLGIYSVMHPLVSMFSVGMLMGFWLMSQGFNLIAFGFSSKGE